MPEYIEREALMQDISETVVFSVRSDAKLPTSEMRGANKVIDRIKSAPTADVVAVVRCRNCKYFNNQFNICKQLSPRDYVVMNEDDFCSYGERK